MLRRVNFIILYVAVVLRPSCFTPFCFNVPYQYTPFLNLSRFIFSLTYFGCLRPTTLTPTYSIISIENIIFYLRPFTKITTTAPNKDVVYKEINVHVRDVTNT
jgi:hypothetical protein